MENKSSKETYIGIAILVMFLISAPSIQIMLSLVASLIAYIIIPAAILVRLFDIYLLGIPSLRRFVSRILDVENVESVRLYLTVESDEFEVEGPFELPERHSVSSISNVPPLQSASLSDGSSDTYDNLSEISPYGSPTFPTPITWRSNDDFQPFSDDRTLQQFMDQEAGGKLSHEPPQLTELTPVEPSSATAPRPVEPLWNREAFLDPAVQEKLKTQSILYHQIHDLLSSHIVNNADGPQNPESTIEPISNVRIEGVDEERIRRLKERFPDKKALHKHLDSFSATMKKFAALTRHDELDSDYNMSKNHNRGVSLDRAGLSLHKRGTSTLTQ